MMRDAVLRDLGQLHDVWTICTYDPRLPPPIHAHQAIVAGDDVWGSWKACIAQADAVLPIAPESGNILLTLTKLVIGQGKVLLGCGVEGVDLASSKLATCRTLQSAGIDVVPTYEASMFPVHQFGQCVAKPDDGAGCEGAFVFTNDKDFRAWLAGVPADAYVAQPYLSGTPASLSMLCKDGRAWLLSCNLQKISLQSGGFVYNGSVVNGAAEYWPKFERLAQSIAQAIPELAGYVGVDVIIRDDGIFVLEINPRLTTSYVGLQLAMGCNPAGLLVDLLYNARFSSAEFQMSVTMQRNKVEVSLDG
jgi:predicted ATP-grasp superfamily ATP-dependent carboligase